MCLLHSAPIADEQFAAITNAAECTKLERRLARMAEVDTIEIEQGLGQLLKTVKQWTGTEIQHVRKYRIGRHRIYVAGRHTDCNYRVVWALINKRDEDDTPADPVFKRTIWKGDQEQRLRLIAVEVLNPPAPQTPADDDQ